MGDVLGFAEMFFGRKMSNPSPISCCRLLPSRVPCMTRWALGLWLCTGHNWDCSPHSCHGAAPNPPTKTALQNSRLHPNQLLAQDEDCPQLPICDQELLTRVKVIWGQNHTRDLPNSLTLWMWLDICSQALHNSGVNTEGDSQQKSNSCRTLYML